MQTKYGEYKWLSQGPNNAKGGEKPKRGELIGSQTTSKGAGHATRTGEEAGSHKAGDERLRNRPTDAGRGETTERRGRGQEVTGFEVETAEQVEKTGPRGDEEKGKAEMLERSQVTGSTQAGCFSNCIVM